MTDSTARLTFNPNIAALPPYNSGLALEVARQISGRHEIARLASNENPFGCSPKVTAALASDGFQPWRYADPACATLKEALSKKLGVDPSTLVVGNGSEELIAAVCRAFLPPGSSAVTVAPSFGLHEIEPLATGARVTKVPMTRELSFDIDGLVVALRRSPQLLLISSPSNPVGTALDQSALKRLISARQPSTLFLIDEAYFEFGKSDLPDSLAMLQGAAVPFVVLRTFSKAYGLAGLRVGYGICSDTEIARVVSAAKPPFNVNGAAQMAAVAALEDEAWMSDAVGRIRIERERIASELSAKGFRFAPSLGNFFFIDVKRPSADVADALLRQGVLVKPWKEDGYKSYIRASIGTRDENDRLVSSLVSTVLA